MPPSPLKRTVRACAAPAALCAILAWSIPPAGAQEAEEEALHLERTVADAIALADLPAGSVELGDGIRSLLETRFDLPRVARALLGRYWRRISPDQREAYLEAFREYVVQQVSIHVPSFEGAEVTVLRTTRRGENDVIVSTRVVSSAKPPLLVDWRIRTGKDGSPRIVDISFEGASMFSVMRAEFQSIVAGQGVDALIASIKELAAPAR